MCRSAPLGGPEESGASGSGDRAAGRLEGTPEIAHPITAGLDVTERVEETPKRAERQRKRRQERKELKAIYEAI